MGALIVEDEWHKGEILVERHGLLHPKYIFMHKEKQIAQLHWRRRRSGIYDANGLRLDLNVGTMAKTIDAKDDMSRVSRLCVKSSHNPRKVKMQIDLADAEGFIVRQNCTDKAGAK